MSDEPAWVEFSAQFVKERGFLPNKRDRVHADSYHWFVWGACRSRFAQDAPEGKTALDGGKVDSNAPSVNVGPGNGIGERCAGCGDTLYLGPDSPRAGTLCATFGRCPITAESIRREVKAAVLPLVEALEGALTSNHYWAFSKKQETARRLCEEARKQWGIE